MLEVTVQSVNSALKRARASLQRRQQPRRPPAARRWLAREDAIVPCSPRVESATSTRWCLLTDDVFIAMPPEPFGYEAKNSWPLLRRQFAAAAG